METQTHKTKPNHRGTAMVEYALIAALVSIALVVIVPRLNRSVSQAFESVGEKVVGGSQWQDGER